MEGRNVTQEQREQTLALFLNDLGNYTKKDRKFSQKSSMQDPMFYVLGAPPYPKGTPIAGQHPRLESRLILLTGYLLFLTQWSPEKAAETKKVTAGSFLKAMATEGASRLTFGVSDIVVGVGRAVAKELLGKDAEEMLANPWSLIIPLKDITSYELFKANFFTHYLHMQVNHRFEGPFEVSMTYHSGGAHSRADSLYKDLKKLMEK